ncbi:non-ribosomal peptide synthetase [Acinetobacter baumannii]|nr:non-ribosomal peptide synthetase [Acinetobacter baumannii]MCA4288529.1 non-ribosomal peptide synthetase [Acinetobacter baumannii]MCB2283426.1 non-ribosomal peptide synthetase [Acinetobacter baumannii]MCQ8899971.1 non-ribosomal peptide synthetase [Acinetobacter baumannii]MCT6724481.1 non-ribosomal peptide synthetase [Acinetobacter baumannii]
MADDYAHVEVGDYLANIQRNLFEQIPDKTALIYADQTISYAELGANVAKVRRALDLAQIRQHQVVAICLRKSPEHIYAVLACALSGIIWLPVDMDSPSLRQQYILSNSHADLAISTAPVEGLLTLNIDEILKDSAHGQLHSGSAESAFESEIIWQHRHDASPAYYLYTSGSTGTPKCVVLNNRATAHVLQETIDFWCINQNDIHLAATPFHHDMSIFDLMAPLSVGGSLVVPTLEEAKSAVAWADLIERYQVSIWCTVPAMADMLLTSADPKQLQSIRLINQGGDYVKPSVVQKLREILPNTRLISIGGPTETTIWSIWHEITPEDVDVIPYGKEMVHNRYYILNPWGEFCPPGVVGQLYMSGINLANGYLLDGKITQKDFVLLTLPNGEVHRVFRMSDKGYLREDGNIIFAGRDEGYLKVRGVRIAASEVENALLKHPQITDCVVTTCTNPVYEGNELVAIYTTQEAALNSIRPSELRQFLQDYVPNSHIPSRWVSLAQFPITRNGKIDRKALKQTAQDFLYQTYAQTASSKNTQVFDSKMNLQKDSPKYHRHSKQSDLARPSIAQEVIEHLQRSLPSQQESSDVLLDTEILALGMTSGHLSRLAKHLSQQLNTAIQLSDLAKCKTVGEIVHNIESQLDQK